jgi:hypothetical protein
MMSVDVRPESPDSEISLLDIVNFLRSAWKKLAIAALVGAVLGLSSWYILGSYQAEYVLLNNNNNNNSYALDLVSWKMLQKSLPNVAAQIVEEGTVPKDQENLYRAMSSPDWWQKNIIPSYALSKADTKDLAGVSKDLTDSASTTILSLTVTAQGSTKANSLENVRAAAKFLRTGGAYLQIRNILNGYESETVSTVADIRKKITSTEIDLGYQQLRVKNLEDLHKRFLGSANVGQQVVVDVKDSGAKYLPLTTQIIAANSDINQSKEDLVRLHDRLAQIEVLKNFLEEVRPLVEKTPDGLDLVGQLLLIEKALQAKVVKGDARQQEVLDQLHAQLSQIKARFTMGLEGNTTPTVSGKKGMVKSTVGGLAGLFFLTLFVLLGQRVWLSIQRLQVKA